MNARIKVSLEKIHHKGLVSHIIDEQVQSSEKFTQKQWLELIILVLFFLAIMGFRNYTSIPVYVNGILSQIQVILSIYIAVKFLHQGFAIGVVLNVLNIIVIFLAILVTHNLTAVTGLVVSFFTLFQF